jgi:hypothetical protein
VDDTSDTGVIAYLMGSFWLCTVHGPQYPEADEQYEGSTMPYYEYRCDHPGCGKLIAAKEADVEPPKPGVHRWHLTVVFDDVPTQERLGVDHVIAGGVRLEHEAFYDYLARQWGGLDEEFRQDVTLKRLSKGPVSVVARADTCEVLLEAMRWVGYHSVPRRMELNRNGDRD